MTSPAAYDNNARGASTNLLTYSALRITTGGGGGFVAKHWPPQRMTVCEVMCGLILPIVSFTIYTGRGLSNHATIRSAHVIG